MAPRKTEVSAVAELLLEPAEDVDDLAKRVIERVDQLRAERAFAVALVSAHGVTFGYGPYSTPLQARRAIEKGTVPALEGSRAGTVTIYPPRSGDVPQSLRCTACGHGRHTHGVVPRVQGCVVGRPISGKQAPGAPAECGCEKFEGSS